MIPGLISIRPRRLVTSTANASDQSLARLKLLILATNEGLEQKLFGLGPCQSYWPLPVFRGNGDDEASIPHRYDFVCGDKVIAASVTDLGDGDVRVQAICNPSLPGWSLLGWDPSALADGDFSAAGCLRRGKRAYLSCDPCWNEEFRVNEAAAALVALKVEPMGFLTDGPYVQ